MQPQSQSPIHVRSFHVFANSLLGRPTINASESPSPPSRLPTDPEITMAPDTDIVTLENFRDRLPSWAADSPDQLYAIVDMGR